MQRQELGKVINSIDARIRQIDTTAADTSYLNEKEILAIESNSMITVYCAVGKHDHHHHHKTVDELFRHNEPPAPEDKGSFKEKMAYGLKTKTGKAIYKMRKQTVEPVFGIIKRILGFREFSLFYSTNI